MTGALELGDEAEILVRVLHHGTRLGEHDDAPRRASLTHAFETDATAHQRELVPAGRAGLCGRRGEKPRSREYQHFGTHNPS